jgi:NADH-quinone oxidoreductase subunit L
VPLTAPAATLATIAARNDLFQDSVNRAVFERPGTHLTRTLVYADAALVDGAVNATGAGTAKTGEAFTKLQSGKVRAYALIMAAGLLIAAFFAVLGGK